jgi:uncharacterized protein YndB with AHSA1/START domain
MTSTSSVSNAPVSQSVSVKASAERAFDVFTAGIDTWWPRSHHIGKSPLKTNVIEGHLNGRCYGLSVDGTECDWGRVLVWEPPRRIVLAWQITADWQFEPDLARSSEVEIRFTSEAGGLTRVDLEHRHFERHGAGGDAIRTAVSGSGGWPALLHLFAGHVQEHA